MNANPWSSAQDQSWKATSVRVKKLAGHDPRLAFIYKAGNLDSELGMLTHNGLL